MSKREQASTSSDGDRSKKSRRQTSVDVEDGSAMDDTMSLVNRVNEREADFGIIEYISMKNFMCHESLEFEFGPHINFIIGLNGSGKSAVLTALVIGLGGKASNTNRGSSIKNFIKFNKNRASVTVRLRNRGSDAYKPGEYGKSITVERTFSVDGPGGYKIKSHNGVVKSTKREELNHILDQFNIQVDNPVAVLNQDTSRNFLNTGKPTQYYKFFLKATQLEQMIVEYEQAHVEHKATQNIISTKTNLLPQLEAEVVKLEQKYKAIMSLDDLRDKVQVLKNQMAWAFVAEKEKQLLPMVKALKVEEARTPKFEQKIEQSKEKFDTVVKEKEEIYARLTVMSDEVKTIQPLLDKAKARGIDKKKTHRAAVNDVRRVENDITNAMKDKKLISDRIEELRAKTQNNESEKSSRERKIVDLSQKFDVLQSQRVTKETELDRFRSAIARTNDDVRQMRAEEREISHNIDETNQRSRDMENSRNNNLNRYGRWMPDLLQKIEIAHKQNRFHQKPRGPIGANILLRDSKWALAIETSLHGVLRSFCCNDHHDEKVLEQLMRECNIPSNWKPDTMVSKFLPQIHDVSRFRARGHYPTIFDMLDMKDPVLANFLIDKCHIENTILIEDKLEARRVMQDSPPINCSQCFTPNGDQLLSKPSFRLYSGQRTRSEFLSVNVETDLRLLREQVDVLNQQLRSSRVKLDQKNQEIRRNQQEEQKVNRSMMQNAQAMNKIQYEINELKSIEEPEPADIIALEEEVQKYEENVDKYEASMKERKDKAEGLRQESVLADNELKEIAKRMEDMSESVDPMKDRLADVEFKIETHRKEKKHYDGKMKEHKLNMVKQNKEITAFKGDIQMKIQMANDICERIEVARTPRDLESEIIQILRQLDNEERSQGDKKKIVEDYHSKSESYFEIDREVKQFKKFLKCLEDCLKERFLCMEGRRNLIASVLRNIFIGFLAPEKYNGTLIFDHRKEELAIRVQPTVSRSGDGSRDVKALSGGERSFSTVCFILSLWQAMESPFRCLDEFDVFMDMVNRRISMDMMMRAAACQQHRQFIFLTPLDISTLDLQQNVKIFRMPDPVRAPQAAINNRGEDEDDDS